MFNFKISMGVINNPLKKNIFNFSNDNDGNIPPEKKFFWVTNTGAFMITNNGDNMIFDPND